MKGILWLTAFLLCGIYTFHSRAIASNGPIPWTDPAQPPKLQGILGDKAYADQSAEMLEKYKPEQVTPDMPFAGVMVRSVDAGSQAKLLGIKPGDVLAYSNDQQIYDDTDWVRHRKAGDTSATVWSPTSTATGSRNVALQPGLIGIIMKPYLHPEVLYLRELPQGEKPDPVLFAAAASAQDSPKWTRAAIARLQKAGSANQFVYFVDAIAALAEGHFDDAISSGMWAINTGSANQKRILAPMMRAAALASFHLDLAEKLEEDYPQIRVTDSVDEETGKDYTVDLEKTVEACKAIKWAGADDCADAIALLKPEDQTAKMVSIGKGGAGGKEAAESIRQSRRTPFNAPPDHYNLYILGPAGPDVKFSARCHFAVNKNKPSTYTEASVKFGVSLRGKKLMPISLSLTADGDVEIIGTNMPDFSYRLTNAYEPGKPFEITVIVVGNRCEIDIAGMCAFYGPILEDEKTRKLCVVFQAVGVKGQLNQVNWQTATPQP